MITEEYKHYQPLFGGAFLCLCNIHSFTTPCELIFCRDYFQNFLISRLLCAEFWDMLCDEEKHTLCAAERRVYLNIVRGSNNG